MKKTTKSLSIFLTVCLIFVGLNSSAFAENEQISTQTDPQLNTQSNDDLVADQPDEILYNDTSPDLTGTQGLENSTRESLIIPDGVYAIVSYGTDCLWMTIENGSPWEGATVKQYFSTSDPTENFERSSLFKISRVGTTSKYIIRSMLNNRMTITCTADGQVTTKMIPADDSDVDVNDTFAITLEDTGGYSLQRHLQTYIISMDSKYFPNLSTPTYYDMDDSDKIQLVPYTGSHQKGTVLYRPAAWGSIGNVVGDTSKATFVGWSTRINANTLSADISAECADMGTLSWDATKNEFTLLAENPGRVRINVKINYADGTNVHSAVYSHMIVPQAGTYYIKNEGTGKYIDIEGPSTSIGAKIQQWQYHVGYQEKWILEHVSGSGGYIRLKSVYSNLYIGIDSADTASVKQYSTQNDYTLWKIDRSNAGNLIFTCKATESSGNVLAVPRNLNINGTDLTQLTYTDNSNRRDEWKLRPIKYSFTVNHYIDEGYKIRFNSTGEDISEYQDICSQILLELFGVNSSYTVSTYCSCADTCTGTPTTLLDTTTACAHSNTDHKTRSNIKNDIVSLYNAGDDTTAKIAWTGHVLESRSSCSYSSSHVIVMTIGMVTDISNNNKAPNVIRSQRIYTLLHEISHQIGAPDHYCYDESSSNCNNPTNDCWRCDNGLTSKPVCVMTDRTYDIESRLLAGNADTLYCDQCKSATHSKGILTHLEGHHK